MAADALSIAISLAESPIYRKLLAEQIQKAYSDEIAAAIKPLADAIVEMSVAIGRLVARPDAAPADPVDLTPLALSISGMGQAYREAHLQTMQAMASLESAVMADVKLVNGAGGRPVGTTKVKK